MTKVPNLFVLLKENNVSRKELCSAIGVTNSNITGWKNGDYSPSIDVVIQIAHYFNVTTDYLLGIAPNIKPDVPQLDPADQELLTLFHDLTLDQQSFIVTTINALVVKNDSEARKKRCLIKMFN